MGADLQGYLIGNAATGERRFDLGFKIPFAHGVGLISDDLYEVTHCLYECFRQSFKPAEIHTTEIDSI